ncbi:hypothetical protein AcetOrient_orf04494 [Acetobacter orientalis]|uniref:Uncharacterized protein n=1 Tax=Acetobacter orientalis TaxID=146474 RepID=A0A2Z5ZLV9_9PROT|nr:hypothetical protein AcetOrient_orf04494 [Acetobacter orientalis]
MLWAGEGGFTPAVQGRQLAKCTFLTNMCLGCGWSLAS